MKTSILYNIGICLMLFSQLGYAKDGYKIKISFKNITDTTIQLGHHFADKQYIDFETEVSSRGVAVFEGDEALHGGLYLLILPGNKYIELIMADDQEFSVEVDTTNLVAGTKITGCLENELFHKAQRFLKEQRAKVDEINARKNWEGASGDSVVIYEAQLKSIDNELRSSWKKIVQENPGTFYANLLMAMNGDEGDFFDNIDFSDERLLFSNVIYTTVRKVMARDLNAKKSSKVVISNSDKLIEKARANKEVFQYVVTYLLNFYNTFYRLGMNEVFVHLADKYVVSGDADWYDSTAVSQIKDRMEVLSASFEGKIAPNVKLKTLKGDSVYLHDIKAKYTLVLFWNTGCGHCTKATERIRDFYDSNPKMDFEVFSVYTKKNLSEWKSYIEEHKVNKWINCVDPEMTSNVHNLFYVVSTPIAFLLDKDKKIISRKFGDTDIINMVDQLEEQKDKFLAD